jgi:MFS transporter, SP family, sugar:H+ symporter
VVGLYAFSHILAGFIASVITDRTSKLAGDASWKIPVGCMFIFPVFAILAGWVIPESPRWYIRKDMTEKAVTNIFYLHSADPTYPAEKEAQLIREALVNAPTQGGWSELFKGTNKVCNLGKYSSKKGKRPALINSHSVVLGPE